MLNLTELARAHGLEHSGSDEEFETNPGHGDEFVHAQLLALLQEQVVRPRRIVTDYISNPLEFLDEQWKQAHLFLSKDPLSYLQGYTVRWPNPTGKNQRIRNRRIDTKKLPFSLTFTPDVQTELGLRTLHDCFLVINSSSQKGLLHQAHAQLFLYPEWGERILGPAITAQVLANLGIWSSYLHKKISNIHFGSKLAQDRLEVFSELASDEVLELNKALPILEPMLARFITTIESRSLYLTCDAHSQTLQ